MYRKEINNLLIIEAIEKTIRESKSTALDVGKLVELSDQAERFENLVLHLNFTNLKHVLVEHIKKGVSRA